MFLRSLISFSLLVLLLSAAAGKVEGSRYGIYENKVRIVLDLSESKDFKVFTLENPRRIVVDIYGVEEVDRLTLPEGFVYTAVKQPSGVRIIIYYSGDFSLKYFKLKDPDRIVLDIYKEDNDLYAELVKIIGEEPQKKRETQDPISELIKKARSRPLAYEERVVVIDAGHGGKDPGAIGHGGVREKDVNLAIALKVAEYLRADGRFKVILTRDGDHFVELAERAKVALRNRADLFVSIHSDAAPDKNPEARGTQVFALSYERAAEKKEQILKNSGYAKLVLGKAADTGSIVVKKVLADLAIDVTLKESVYFGRILAQELREVLGEEVHFKGINRAGFAVLKTPGIPSVLVETGFITNPSEAERLSNPEFQRKVAWSIYRAIVRYFYGETFRQKLAQYQ